MSEERIYKWKVVRDHNTRWYEPFGRWDWLVRAPDNVYYRGAEPLAWLAKRSALRRIAKLEKFLHDPKTIVGEQRYGGE